MFWFTTDNRSRLVSLLEDIVTDEREFEAMFAQRLKKLEDRELRSYDAVRRDIVDSAKEGNAQIMLSKLEEMVKEDTELFHLILELQKKGNFATVNASRKNSLAVLRSIAKELLENTQYLSSLYDELLNDYLHVRAITSSISRTTPALRTLQNTLLLAVESEKRSIGELETELRKGSAITEGKLFSISDGALRVEMHKEYCSIHFNPGDKIRKTRTYAFGILVFDRDYFVAEMGIEKYDGKDVYIADLLSVIRGRGYMFRAIELLLKTRKIESVYSDKLGNQSYAGIELYNKFKFDKKYAFEMKKGRYHISLRK